MKLWYFMVFLMLKEIMYFFPYSNLKFKSAVPSKKNCFALFNCYERYSKNRYTAFVVAQKEAARELVPLKSKIKQKIPWKMAEYARNVKH